MRLTCEKRQMPLAYDMLFINQYKKYEHKIKPKHKKNQKRQKKTGQHAGRTTALLTVGTKEAITHCNTFLIAGQTDMLLPPLTV